MIRKISSSLWVAALALALGISPAAHALIIQGAKDSVTYAKETLPKADAITKDGAMHYLLAHDLTVNAPAGIGAQSGDIYTVTYTLNGMVFGAPTADITGFTKQQGGAMGEKTVTYRYTADAVLATTASIDATFRFAVSESGGSIMRTVINESLPESLTRSESHTGHVMVAPALKETVMETDPVTAMADHQFLAFGGTATNPHLKAMLGSLEVGVVEGMVGMTPNPTADPVVEGRADTRPRIATFTGTVPPGGDASGFTADTGDAADANGIVDRILEIMGGLAATDETKSTATVAGDVSFVKRIGFTMSATDADACPSSATMDIRMPAEAPATGYTNEFMALRVNNDAFNSTGAEATNDLNPVHNLCLEADGETPIPAGAYTITTSYVALTASAFGPEGAEHTLGTIVRDGSSVHIPYLSTYDGYRQRLILRNRNNREVTYTLTFVTESGVTVSPMSITDTLDAGELKTLRVQDMVEITGSTRMAATLSSDAATGTLDVASTIVNVEDRSTDTIRY